MLQPLYLQLGNDDAMLSPKSLVVAIQSFVGILNELDASISHDPRGTVIWGIDTISKQSPAVIGFAGKSLFVDIDHVPAIQAECVSGLALLEHQGERSPVYSDAALAKVKRLAGLYRARQQDRIGLIEVFRQGEAEARIRVSPSTVDSIADLLEGAYVSEGSIVGSLDTITVHSGYEFRVWEEVFNKAVTCRFPPEMLDQTKELLGQRVLVHGQIKTSPKGFPVLVVVDGFEHYPDEAELPTIEQMSGLISDFTDGLSLEDYLEEIRGGDS